MVYFIPMDSAAAPKEPLKTTVKSTAVKWLSGIQLVLAIIVFSLQIRLVMMRMEYPAPTVLAMNAHNFGLIVGAVNVGAAAVSIVTAIEMTTLRFLLALGSQILAETGLIIFLVSIARDLSQIRRRHENLTSRGLLTVGTVTGSLLLAIFSLLIIIISIDKLWKLKGKIEKNVGRYAKMALKNYNLMRNTYTLENKSGDAKECAQKFSDVPFRVQQARIIGWSQLVIAAILCVAQMPMSENALPWKVYELLAVTSFVLIVHWITITKLTYLKLIGFIALQIGSTITVTTILSIFGDGDSNSYYRRYRGPQGFLISFGILLIIQSGGLIAMAVEPIWKLHHNNEGEKFTPISVGVEVKIDDGEFHEVKLDDEDFTDKEDFLEKPKESQPV